VVKIYHEQGSKTLKKKKEKKKERRKSLPFLVKDKKIFPRLPPPSQ
jgi:hypothetical protein